LRNVQPLVHQILSHLASQAGAGLSTAAGIPDFRSPGSGLYNSLKHLNLPYPEAVFELDYFRKNPLPFYTLARDMYPGKFRPTIAHSFIKLLHDKGLLLKAFTQNIDCLEREAGLPEDAIVEAHGSFAGQSCIDCSHPCADEDMSRAMEAEKIPCCTKCRGFVKPNIVFFGESLPAKFRQNVPLIRDADLVIIMGTSLTVSPFAQLPQLVRGFTPRLLINLERVGDLGSRKNDVLYLGKCDDGVRELAKACGWLKELEARWAKTKPWEAKENEGSSKPMKPTRDQRLQAEVDKLASQIEQTLKLANELTDPTAERAPAKKEASRNETDSKKSQRKPFKGTPSAGDGCGKDSKSVNASEPSTTSRSTNDESGQL
jgi:NAD-dependent histone deacetylase SIR2